MVAVVRKAVHDCKNVVVCSLLSLEDLIAASGFAF